MISIIIRTKNEEKWISACLRSIFSQSLKDFEIIIVDNYSTDKTIFYAKKFKVKVVKIKKYLPGKALNLGIRKSAGDIIVILSAHCIPTHNKWLNNLTKDLKNKDVAGVYGRQQPLSFSSDFDKRDLLNFFGLDKKIQKRDSFFHNANSAIKREVWKKFKFNEVISNIEDRVWGEQVIENNMKLVYEPKASVYHYHGIHQDMDPIRAKNIVRILEDLNKKKYKNINKNKSNKPHVICIIPISGKSLKIGKEHILKNTIESAFSSKYVNKVFVATDNKYTANLSKKYGADSSFLRPVNLSENFIDESEILDFVLSKFQRKKIIYDAVVCIKETYPFRNYKLIDQMIDKYFKNKTDTIIAVKKEERNIWLKDKENSNFKIEGIKPRFVKKNEILISLAGLCYVTNPFSIKNSSVFNGKIDYYEVKDFYQPLEVGKSIGLLNKDDYKLLESILKNKK